MTEVLPKGFADLEPFTQPWVELDNMERRYQARQDMSFAELQQFYDAASPRLAEILVHLDAFGGDPLPPAEGRLYRVALGLVEAAQANEFFGSSRLPRAPYPHYVAVGGKAARLD